MKIDKADTKTIIDLKLIQTKVYTKKRTVNSIKINQITPRLKKVLNIIYKYNIKNKRILFVGTPVNLDNKFQELVQSSKHLFIPESVWLNGILTNKDACFKYLAKNQNNIDSNMSKILFQLKKKIDLIVILDISLNETIRNESYFAKIPVISFNCNLDISDTKSSYKIPGNFTKKKLHNNFLYYLLFATLKRANLIKISQDSSKIYKHLLRRFPVLYQVKPPQQTETNRTKKNATKKKK
jgi:ribosomal protein S2